MKIYLAATSMVKDAFSDEKINPSEINVLESFFSMQSWQCPLIPKFNDFLLDSGAFTFLKNKKIIDYERYADEYADFIIKYQIKKYFELDLDAIIGINKTEKLRERIEQKTKIKSIPVWHKNRGKQYFIDMCKEYPYVALGGIALQEISKTNFELMFPWFINVAHINKAKIHGLGYTNLKGLTKYHFNSVDSTTWTMGSRYGQIMEFRNGTIIKHNSVKNGVKYRKIKNVQDATLHNFMEWVKYTKYMENK